MKVEIDTGSLNEILGLVTKIKTVLNQETVEYLSASAVVARTTRKTVIEQIQQVDGKSPMIGQEYNRELVCKDLNSDLPQSPDISIVNTQKQYYQYIHIGAMKIVVTFKLQKSEIDFDP